MSLELRTTEVTLVPKGEPIFNEQAISIKIVDEAAGEFIQLQGTSSSDEEMKFQIDPTEWQDLKKAIDMMIKGCRSYE